MASKSAKPVIVVILFQRFVVLLRRVGTRLKEKITETINKLVSVQHKLNEGFVFWRISPLDETEKSQFTAKLDEAKTFLEALQAYTTPGKLKNFKFSESEVIAKSDAMDALASIISLESLIAEFSPIVGYLTNAELLLPEDHPWAEQVQKARTDLIAGMKDASKRSKPDFVKKARKKLGNLKGDYITAYIDLHAKARLGVNEEKRKNTLNTDPRHQSLKDLATIEILPKGELTDFENKLANLRECSKLIERELGGNPLCSHCDFRPREESVEVAASTRLGNLDQELDRMLESWTKTLYENLMDPTIEEQLNLLKPEQKTLIEDFKEETVFSGPITHEFITAMREALQELQKVTMSMEDLRNALSEGGGAVTMDDLKKRFDDHLDGLAKGKDRAKVRVVLE